MSDLYVRQILDGYSAFTPLRIVGVNVALNSLTPILANWAGTQLSEIKLSGSYAKGTAL